MNKEGESTLTIRKSNRVTDGFKGSKGTLFIGERAYVEINIPLRGGDDLFLHGNRDAGCIGYFSGSEVLLFGSYVSERELPLAVTQAYEQEDDTEPSALSVPLEGATLEDVEREAILRMLDSVGDNKSEAAKRLGISRKTLHTKLKRYGQEQD